MVFLRLFTIFLFLPIFIFSNLQTLGQDIEATTSDGKKVILKSDQTWVYKKDSSLPLPKLQSEESTVKPFIITDIDLILDTYSKGSALKSEFETEKEYLTRIEAMDESILVKGKKIKDAFLYLPSEPNYSAEENKFSFDFFRRDIPRTKKSPISVELVRRNCQNFLKMLMNIGKDIPCGDFVWGEQWRYIYENPYVKMTSDEARIMKSRLKLAVSGIPIELDKYGNLKLKVISWIIFDIETEKIYYSHYKN
ncbi:MAG: hypothetical protein ACR2MG_00210 [Pyrinomonadaceae bacterium]